jgi:hypothetical protein
MNAERLVRHLTEEPDNDPLDFGPLEPYAGPIAFNSDVKSILDHALLLKTQAEQAGALHPNVIGNANQQDIHCALLMIACEEFIGDRYIDRTVKRLKRAMHSVWR